MKQKRIRDIWKTLCEFQFLTYEELTSELKLYNLKQLIRLEVEMVDRITERERQDELNGFYGEDRLESLIRQGLGGVYKTINGDILKCIRETPLMKIEIRDRKLQELGL
jgi:hypothetical protein